MTQPQPSPLQFDMTPARINNVPSVVLNVRTVLGPLTFFLPAEQAEELGTLLANVARQSKTGLILP